MRILPIAALFTATLAGCTYRLTNYDGYHGDGTFTRIPAPSVAFKDSYRVDLGGVDLSQTSSVDGRLDGLPPTETTIGIAFASSDQVRSSALITVTLRDEKNHIVLSRQERLSDWVRYVSADDPQHAYLYQRGGFIDVAVAPDVVHHQHFPIGEDDSWGTCFTPRRGARYTLHFEVNEADAASAGLDAHLQVRAIAGCL
jgi:hypothetical protein